MNKICKTCDNRFICATEPPKLCLKRAKLLKVGDIIHNNGYYNSDGSCRRWKVNGKVKLWKTMPHRVRIPVKYGLSVYSYITEDILEYFHFPEDCTNPKG